MSPAWARALGAIALASVLGPASAADDIEVPAWSPRPGVEVRYEIQIENSGGAIGKDPVSTSCAMIQAMTVEKSTPDGVQVRWRLTPGGPPASGAKAACDSPAGNYGKTLALWGVDQLLVEEDATGIPIQVVDGDALRARVRKQIETIGPPGGARAGLLDTIMKTLDRDPAFPVRALAPAAVLLAAVQGATAKSMRLGDIRYQNDLTFTQSGVQVPMRVTWTLAGIDSAGGTVHFVMRVDIDQAAFATAAKPVLDRELAGYRASHDAVPPDVLTELSGADVRREGQARISLSDGATEFAEESIVFHLGAFRSRVTTRVTRRSGGRQ